MVKGVGDICRSFTAYASLLLVVTMVACGGGSGGPSTPTAPTPPAPIPAASIVASGQAQWTPCLSDAIGCAFAVSIQNVGVGCATDVSVVTRFYGTDSGQVGSDLAMAAIGGGLATRTVRPNEIIAISSVTFVTPAARSVMSTYRLYPTWTNVRCP